MPTLTDIFVRSLKPSATGQVTHWDSTLPGFGVRVSSGGTKTFILVHGRARKRESLGRVGIITLADARTEAKRILAAKTLGLHKPSGQITFPDALAAFLEASQQRNRPRTVSDYAYYLRRHCSPSLGHKRLSDITYEDVQKILAKLAKAPTQQNNMFVRLRAFFKWAVRSRYLPQSPIEGMQMPAKTRSRDRVLTDGELVKVAKKAFALENTYSRIVSLLICTGQRRGETAALEWDWVDLEEKHITLPARITKNKREHRFPISDRVVQILKTTPKIDDSSHVFPATRSHVAGKPTTVFNGWNKPFLQFVKGMEVDPFVLHDFRRTISSKMAELGVSQTVVEKLLNHVSGGTQSPIAQVYNRYNFMSEMRDAINRYEAHLAKLVAAC